MLSWAPILVIVFASWSNSLSEMTRVALVQWLELQSWILLEDGSCQGIDWNEVRLINDVQITKESVAGGGGGQIQVPPIVLFSQSQRISILRWCHHFILHKKAIKDNLNLVVTLGMISLDPLFRLKTPFFVVDSITETFCPSARRLEKPAQHILPLIN